MWAGILPLSSTTLNSDDKKKEAMKHTEQSARAATPFARVKGLAGQKEIDMSGVALQPDLRSRLQLLASEAFPVVSASSVDVLREAGLSREEIKALVFVNQNQVEATTDGILKPEDAARFKKLAGLLSHSISVYGSENALLWLRGPLQRFDGRSPLKFVEATQNFEAMDEYLTQNSEGYFF
jgi:uncharacterized protein (DUF2384 family)